jgi:hypothetical protein
MNILESADRHENLKYVMAVRMYEIMLNLSSEISQINFYDTHKTITTSLTHPLTHGAVPFLRSGQLCSYSRTSQHFMEPEGG